MKKQTPAIFIRINHGIRILNGIETVPYPNILPVKITNISNTVNGISHK